VILSDLVKYSMTRGVARSLCDSWASCFYYCEMGHFWIFNDISHTINGRFVPYLAKWL